MAAQLAFAVHTDGLTVDEMPYIGCGYRHLRHSDFRMNPEQPPVAKMLAAAPLLLLPIREPEPPVGDDQIGWPDRFLHEVNRDQPVLAYARAATVLAALAMAVLLWRIARHSYGKEAGLFALALAAFHPSLLAHGHLATTDFPSALTFLVASWTFWHWCQAPRAAVALLVGAAVGLAVTTRLTAWLLVPVFALLLVPWWIARPRATRTADLRALAALVVFGALGIAGMIWTIYGFHFAPWPGASALRAIDPHLGLPGGVLALLHEWKVLPDAYLEGMRFQLEHNRHGHSGYLLGTRGSGWRHYYVVACVVKNTPGFLLLTAIVASFLWRTRRRLAQGAPELHWLAPALAIFTVASLARIQLGERYVLAIYPYVILLAAAAAATVATWRGGRVVLAVALVLHIVPALRVADRGYLAYFNALAGGPDGGHHFLADSNLDWGQDLPRLAAWMKRGGVGRLQLGYFGSDEADRYGIVREDLPTWGASRPQRPAPQPFHGTIAVSANLLLGFLFAPEDDPYAFLRGRAPDARAGAFFIYHLPR
jgi:hypothetical protein